MNIETNINPVMRSLLVITGFAGFASFMFFRDEIPASNILALSAIIPFIIGMLGDNLFKSLTNKDHQLVLKHGLNQQSATATPLYPSPPDETDPIEKRAA